MIAILVPSLGRVRKRAYTTKCAITVRTLNMALATYVLEWKTGLPYVSNIAVHGAAWNNVLRTTYDGGYGITLKARICPEAMTSNEINRPVGGDFVWFGGANF